MKKSVQEIMSPPPPHMVGDGFRVHNYIPGLVGMQRMNPFIMMDYNSPHYFPPSDTPPGVGVHPHRGFETVTIAYKGKVSHHDSAGNSGTIGEGEVQWMTAASGVLHKEGVFQMVQLWVNLPAKDKMSPPRYQALTKADIQTVELENDNGKVEIIAGEFNGVKGPAKTFSPVTLMNAFLPANGEVQFSFPQHDHTALVVISGKIKINHEEEASANQLVIFQDDGEDFSIQAIDESVVLILNGEPIPEPIAAYGPFVMNTREEIIQAYQDFQMGKFGQLED